MMIQMMQPKSEGGGGGRDHTCACAYVDGKCDCHQDLALENTNIIASASHSQEPAGDKVCAQRLAHVAGAYRLYNMCYLKYSNGLVQDDAQQLREQGYAVMNLDELEHKGTLFHADVAGRFHVWVKHCAPRLRDKLMDVISGHVKARRQAPPHPS